MTSKRKNPCTNWFPGHVKPVRVGVYKRMHPNGESGVTYSYWNGEWWGPGVVSHVFANMASSKMRSTMQNLPWCGLANNPKGAEK